jgi:high-affinity iron transporter
MLLNAVITVLRETIEAGILVSVLLALGNQRGLNIRWLLISLAIGACMAALYAHHLIYISEWFDYTGQEVMNAGMQVLIYCCLLWVCVALSLTDSLLNKHLIYLFNVSSG